LRYLLAEIRNNSVYLMQKYLLNFTFYDRSIIKQPNSLKMKKNYILVIILLMTASLMVNAQTEKGKLFVAGTSQIGVNTGGEHYKYGSDVPDESKYAYHEFTIQPKIGYTFIKRMPIGVFIDLDSYMEKNKSTEDKYRDYSLALGPFIRYYFADIVGLMPYAEAEIGYGSYREGSKLDTDDEWDMYDKEAYFTYQIGGGLTYFFNDHVGMDMFMGFHHYSYTWEAEDASRADETKNHDIYNEFTMQMGVVVMIKCHK
jgi:hypothetical protein